MEQSLQSLAQDCTDRMDGFTIGCPTSFAVGQFSGCTIRMELSEIQQANLGRKYARVDRRPLDPPPIVQLRIFETHDVGTMTEVETEVDYENIQTLGFICTVDLFPVSESFAPSQSCGSENATYSETGQTIARPSSSTSSIHNLNDDYLPFFGAPFAHNLCPISSSEWKNQHTHSNDIFPSQAGTRVVHHLRDFSITENMKQTNALAGATFVQAVKLELKGKTAILFAFSDLAVRTEGVFILRYRVFDLFSYPSSQADIAVIGAEAYGGAFRVYSTKDFPGLPVSTDLTKNLVRWGVRLNSRETERRRQKRSDESP